MIRRNSSKYIQDQERLEQQSFTGIKGIDCSKIHTDVTTVYDMRNLDIDLDGGLKLRKPLTAVRKSPDQIYNMYNGKILEIGEHLETGEHFIKSPKYTRFKLYDMYNTEHIVEDINGDFIVFIDCTNCTVINTATSTLLYNCKVNFEYFKGRYFSEDTDLINENVEPSTQFRIIKLSKENSTDENILEILPVEMNILTTNDIPLDYNLALNYPLAIRDNYDASAINITGIIAYANSSVSQTVDVTAQISDFPTQTYDPDTTQVLIKTGASEYTFNSVVYSLKYSVYGSFYKTAEGATSHYNIVLDDVDTRIVEIDTKITLNDGSEVQNIKTTFKGYGSVLITGKDEGLYDDFKDIVSVEFTLKINNNTSTIDQVTETTSTGWSFLKNLDESVGKTVCLKAFLDIPHSFKSDTTPYILLWEKSTDGANWSTVISESAELNSFLDVSHYEINTQLLSDDKTISWIKQSYRKLSLKSLRDLHHSTDVPDPRLILNRPDCLVLSGSKLSQNQMYRCSIYSTKHKSAYEYLENNQPPTDYVRDVLISTKTYMFNSNLASLADVEYVNPYTGNVLYYKKSLYAYGEGLDNVVYVSAPDSAMFPITNVIDLSSVQDAYVTSVIPWRDYLMISTENSIHLASRAEIGYTTKILNTFVGIPEHDSKTGSAILNGIIFKSGSKIYTMFPNLNAGTETIFNTSEISKPVEHILNGISEHKDYKPFAITTSDAYNLFIPCSDNTTICLKYMFTQKRWTCYNYPVLLYRFDMLNADDIHLYGYLNDTDACVEYMFNKDSETYADTLGEMDKDKNFIETPIKFFLDSGQKTDNISITKQFVESKVIASTQSAIDNFNMDIRVDIDGNTFEKHIDVNTDGAFLRNNSHILSLNTSVLTSVFTGDTDILNTFRQMFLRYSGKGKTIRHIISGESVCPFKIYEVFFRYKYLNVKQ